MALDQSLATKLGRNGSIVRQTRGSGGYYKKMKTKGADIWIGAGVTRFGETGSFIDLCAKGEPLWGIVTGEWHVTDLSHDADNPFAANTWVLVYVFGRGDQIYLTAKTNTAITKDVKVQCEAGFFIPYAYTDGTQATDLLESVFGVADEAVTATAATEKTFLATAGVA